MNNQQTVLNHSNARRQSGVVLVISLIMLLALTLIGVTSSNVTGLEEKMAANNKDVNLALQAAEAALREAEDSLTTQHTFDRAATNANQGTGGYYTLLNNDETPTTSPTLKTLDQYMPFYSQVDWYATSNPKYMTYNNIVANGKKLVGLSRPPEYIIEEMSSAGSSTGGSKGGSLCGGCPLPPSTSKIVTLRITAQGWGSNNSTALVQSTVKVTYN
jgi:type IV pilus assembly protein PilX